MLVQNGSIGQPYRLSQVGQRAWVARQYALSWHRVSALCHALAYALQQAFGLVKRNHQQHDEKSLHLGCFNQRQFGGVREHGFTHKRSTCFKQCRPAGIGPQACVF